MVRLLAPVMATTAGSTWFRVDDDCEEGTGCWSADRSPSDTEYYVKIVKNSVLSDLARLVQVSSDVGPLQLFDCGELHLQLPRVSARSTDCKGIYLHSSCAHHVLPCSQGGEGICCSCQSC